MFVFPEKLVLNYNSLSNCMILFDMLFVGSAPTFDALPATENIQCDFTTGNTITTVDVTDSDSTSLSFTINSVTPSSALFDIHSTTGKNCNETG